MSKSKNHSRRILAAAASTLAFNAGGAPASGSSAHAQDEVPQWIWSTPTAAPNEEAFFRRSLDLHRLPAKATLRLSCDNLATIYLADREIGSMDDWTTPIEVDLTPFLSSGRNDLVVHAQNQGGPAGLLAVLGLEFADGSSERVVTDSSWVASADAAFTSPQPAKVLGAHGVDPWGVLRIMPAAALDRHIEVAPGFTVDLVYSVPRSQGSWVSLAVDDQGRIITSDQYGSLYRTTLASGDESSSNEIAVEQIGSTVGSAQGLACVGKDLYCVVSERRAEGPGLYRLRDTDGDDQYDTEILLRSYPGRGEHGPHAVIEGPDGMIYVVAGNHTPLPKMERSAVPRRWDEDHLLPRMWDARGHAVGILAPGGWIARTDPEGASWELLSVGYRNPYDIAFNRDGELFTYDADMEWDLGAPWYRPTRINHAVSGSEFGWRAGTAKWPTHYPDSLPAVVDIGPGSPTGISFGYETNFPQRYRDALFILDWTFGTMYAVSLTPEGASYSATRETFLTGRPLPLADVAVNPTDGALYFIVGGRNTPSALYRVRYTGAPDPIGGPPSDANTIADSARAQRKAIESLHRDDAPASSIDEIIWPALDHDDRFIRFAARVALEHQPLDRWSDRAFRERDPQKKLALMLAMARCGDEADQSRMATALGELRWTELDRTDRLTLLRCWSLCFIRLGEPDDNTAKLARELLTPVYPSGDDAIDRELCDLLVYLQSPTVVARTVPLMEQTDVRGDDAVDPALLSRNDSYGLTILRMAAARPQQGQVYYALALRNARTGWTPELRERYFRWFQTAARAAGGLSYRGFLNNIRDEALENAPPDQQQRLTELAMGDQPMIVAADLPMAKGPGRAWTVDELLDLVGDQMEQRDFENGRAMYTAATCHRCHRFAGQGEISGPDLTAITTRFSTRDLIEALVEPSRTISDQYTLTEFVLNNDRVLLGRIVGQDDDSFTVMSSFLAPDTTYELPREMVATRRPSTVSPMMPNLLDAMNADEARDLMAYLLSEGDPAHGMFQHGANDNETGFVQMFDGVSLANWEGDRRFWRVEDGAIVGQTTSATPAPHNTFLTWTGDVLSDFELRAEVRLIGDNNSGLQYRARTAGDHRLHGYQCDIHPQADYNAMLYEEGGRAIMATHGQQLVIGANGSVTITREDPPSPVESIQQWNEYHIIARGSRLEHRLNGATTIIVDDQDAANSSRSGVIGLQLHAGAPYEARFRNIRFRKLAED